ncbi:MAG: helix-turn-helix domain-containing protein [Candidatus Margulisbacteria bacterium]|nr:helix-turn-helix domain-containing protein [Candidatus Margulisiibacteriota bacterium]
MRRVGIKIRQLREQKNLTIEELADLSGLSYKYLQEVETAKYSFTVSVLHSITQALGISLADFFRK